MKSSSDPESLEANEDRERRLADLITRLSEQVQSGESIDLEATCNEHQEFANDLRALWATVMMANFAGSSGDQRTSKSAQNEVSTRILRLPCRIGDFTLLEELGRGGMGIVYRARQESLHREVAIKMIRNDVLLSNTEGERFVAEAQAAANLDHVGIVPVYEIGETEHGPYFCMKLIEGETLAERLTRGVFGSRAAARLMIQIAEAVQHAHSHGVVHRDLKPSNIILDVNLQPLVTDFGLAKQIDGSSSLTFSGAILGTPSYMSPEQAIGRNETLGPTSDVYSLGCMLYHMLTGRPPMQAATPVDTLLMVAEQDPLPPRMLNRAVDRDLEMIVMKCLQKPTDLRYAGADSLVADLQAYLANEPIAARSGRLLQVAANWFRETHHAPVLENWGLLWMLHSLALFMATLLTNVLYWLHVENRLYYFALWTVGLGAWAAIFWALRHRMGPVSFVERQIAHLWAGSMVCVAALFPLEWWLQLEILSLSPVVALICGFVFLGKAGILSGSFYVQAFVMLPTAVAMAWLPEFAHLIFGLIAACCFFFPGMKYYRVRKRNDESRIQNQDSSLVDAPTIRF